MLGDSLIPASNASLFRGSVKQHKPLPRRFWYLHYQKVVYLPLAAKLHAEVADAVARKEATAAAVASDRLIDYIEDFARKTFMVINRRQ